MGTEVPGDGLGDEFKGYVCLPFFSFFTLQSIGIRAIRILHPGFHGFWRDKGMKNELWDGFDTVMKISAHEKRGD